MASMADEPQLLTLKQVASRLGVSEKTVRRLVRSGRFPEAVMMGGSPRWHPEDVQSYVWMVTRKVARLLETEENAGGPEGTGRD